MSDPKSLLPPPTILDSVILWKKDLASTMAEATSITLNRFERCAEQLLKLTEKYAIVLNERNTLKTQNQVLEIQIKKLKEERAKVSVPVQKS